MIADVVELAVEQRLPITVDMYHHMIDSGVLSDDARVELIEGVIVAVSPQSKEHVEVIEELMRLLMSALGREWAVRSQAPLTLERSEPEPDVYVVARDVADAAPRHPTTAALVVEVARSSLSLDRAMARVYADAGITEYWLVDLEHAVVEVFRDPSPQGYRSHRVEDTTATLAPVAVPGVSIPIAQLLRARH